MDIPATPPIIRRLRNNRAEAKDEPATPRLVAGDIRLIGGLNERLFQLLAAIESSGSINQAARKIGLTYKGAWEMIERANNLSPKILISTATGGRLGGGTRLTPAGKDFLQLFIRIQEEHRNFLEQINDRLMNNRDIVFLLRKLIMKASARNQFFGKVSQVSTGAINVEVTVSLKGGAIIVAAITRESAESLAIKSGADVVALVKVSQIIIVTDFGGYRLSARNQLQGTVSRIQKGEVNAEVVIELKGGNSVVATITNESLQALELTTGKPATAVFKAGAVILGAAS
ncbi:Molybdenum transport protein ModE [Candidatus Methylobacter favarea]|uniref:Molybdenum transport protein ModE n=1 Tax=Candidatus Methylobacter favarea TaxID=2707345 RepID=A0A8S0X3B8_9GAMM|nr:TOBE domain-containing protein [Candidatus Methylobacter favarea]CAA9892604.1 Molybdenum transport protein ModE [Candidatus Methylobacter favarea]